MSMSSKPNRSESTGPQSIPTLATETGQSSMGNTTREEESVNDSRAGVGRRFQAADCSVPMVQLNREPPGVSALRRAALYPLSLPPHCKTFLAFLHVHGHKCAVCPTFRSTV